MNAAFYRLEIDKAEKIAKTYENYSIDRWKNFAEALAHVSEAKAVLDPQVVDEEERDQQMDQLADTEPSPLNLWMTKFVSNIKISRMHGFDFILWKWNFFRVSPLPKMMPIISPCLTRW